MDNATQYQFELIEVAKLLLKKQGISEGLWTIGINFNIGAANAGPNDDSIRPSMIVGVDKLMLTRATEPIPHQLTVDASKIDI